MYWLMERAMLKHLEHRELYDKCCFEYPVIKKIRDINNNAEIYSAQCFSCGCTVETNESGKLAILWNKLIRGVK